MAKNPSALRSKTALQIYLVIAAAVASVLTFADTSSPKASAATPPDQTGYGYTICKPASHASRLEAIRITANDPYREHRQ